jgi:hypothetical protein
MFWEALALVVATEICSTMSIPELLKHLACLGVALPCSCKRGQPFRKVDYDVYRCVTKVERTTCGHQFWVPDWMIVDSRESVSTA